MKEKVSIIIPVYNCEKCISRTLKSIVSQTYEYFEVILVDDGSSDKSREIISELVGDDSRFNYIYQENRGVSSARNRGIKCSSGEYMCFWDADDTVPMDSLEKMIHIMEDKKADLVIGAMARKGTLVERVFEKTKVLSEREYIDKEDEELLYNFSVANKMFKTSIIKENDIWFPKLRHAEDGVFSFDYLQHCSVICGCNSIVYEYYRELVTTRESSMRNVDVRMFRDVRKALELIESLICNYSDSFKKEFYKRALKSTIIHEYYRKLWLLEDITCKEIFEAIDIYRNLITDEQWEEIVEEMSDLEITKHLKSVQEILEEPLITVVLTDKISKKHRNIFMKSLYGQNCPNFEVGVPKSIFPTLSKEYQEKNNLRIISGIENALEESRGKYITFVDADIIYNDNTLQLMYRRIKKWDKEFITVLMVQLLENQRCEIPVFEKCYSEKRIKKNAPYGNDDKADYLMANKLFEINALKSLKLNFDKCNSIVSEECFQKLSFKRFNNVMIIMEYNPYKFWGKADTYTLLEKCKKLYRFDLKKKG